MPEELTARQREVYDAIARYYARHGHMPTFRALCEVVKIKSPNGLNAHLAALIKKGWIAIPHLNGDREGSRPMYALKLLVRDELPPVVKHTRTQISVTLYGPLTPEQARELARQLVQAADAMESASDARAQDSVTFTSHSG